MSIHNFAVNVGDHVFLAGNDEEVGAVRQVARDHLIVYIENAGNFEVRGPAVQSATAGKVVLDPATADPALVAAAAQAHVAEDA